MGQLYSVQIAHQAVSYEDVDDVTCTGETRSQPAISESERNDFEAMGELWLEGLVEDKGRIANATQIFRNVNITSMQHRYRKWPRDFLICMRTEFQAVDWRHECRLDFDQVCTILDEIKDTSAPDVRRALFDETVGELGNDKIDFIQYLGLLYALTAGTCQLRFPEDIDKLSSCNLFILYKLSLVNQLELGLL
ncbi:hypothetical protein NP493_301g01008 [Ridgeia piscesae]|uniref:Uncharacterized protein n=1 Tax=Ridgeia piscesae TaxID=27915 RepID=A0AAD9L5D3_RIDPI|nr:hypothetical protein NP493_301g01008 [Ridgeia piscesae]